MTEAGIGIKLNAWLNTTGGKEYRSSLNDAVNKTTASWARGALRRCSAQRGGARVTGADAVAAFAIALRAAGVDLTVPERKFVQKAIIAGVGQAVRDSSGSPSNSRGAWLGWRLVAADADAGDARVIARVVTRLREKLAPVEARAVVLDKARAVAHNETNENFERAREHYSSASDGAARPLLDHGDLSGLGGGGAPRAFSAAPTLVHVGAKCWQWPHHSM